MFASESQGVHPHGIREFIRQEDNKVAPLPRAARSPLELPSTASRMIFVEISVRPVNGFHGGFRLLDTSICIVLTRSRCAARRLSYRDTSKTPVTTAWASGASGAPGLRVPATPSRLTSTPHSVSDRDGDTDRTVISDNHTKSKNNLIGRSQALREDPVALPWDVECEVPWKYHG